MGCSVSEDTLQCRLEESVSHRRTRQVTQLFTYSLTHKLFNSCIWRYLESHACDWVMSALSATLHISVSNSVCFLPYGSPCSGQHCAVFVVIRYIGHWTLPKKMGKYCSCTERTAKGKTELILTVKNKNETSRREGQFDSEFPATPICNHCGVMTAWSRKTLKFCEQFLRFLKKTTSYGKIFNFFSKSFHRHTDRRCCVQISWNLSDET